MQKIKEAKSEALTELDKIKSQKEQEFLEFKKGLGDVKHVEVHENVSVSKEMKDQVLQKFLDNVARVSPSLHVNSK